MRVVVAHTHCMRMIDAMVAYQQFGKRIMEERTRRGWDQVDLARRLGGAVGQQAVSRWERGGSRPRRDVLLRLADLLEVEHDELLALAGYPRLVEAPSRVRPPVRPRSTVLPVEELPPDKFEE